MLPASVPYLNDLLGRCYRFYHPSQGPRPTSRPMWFGDNFYAHQFLIGLDCDPDFWLQLLVSFGDPAMPAGAWRTGLPRDGFRSTPAPTRPCSTA